MVFVRPVFNGIHNVFLYHRALGSGIVAAAGAV